MGTKENLLRILKNENNYISGEAVSSDLGVSRAAINAAVKSLRLEGYDIASVTNRCYRLVSEPDVLNEASVGAYLSEERMQRVRVLPSVDSTNSELIRLAMAGAPDGQVVAADEQTGGKGRRGRGFSSPKGSGIYFSYLFRPTDELKAHIESTESGLIWASLTSWTAVAASDAIEQACGIRPGIKWVNDLYMNGRKISGILTQMNTSAESRDIETIVIGIGINVRERYDDFDEEIREKAGSIYTETGIEIKRAGLCALLVQAFDKMTADWPDERELYRKRYIDDSILIGRDIVVQSPKEQKEAKAAGIDEDFGLIIENADGSMEHIISGDVSVRF